MWVETQPSVQASFQKLNVDNSCQKNTKLDITFSKSCLILLHFFTLWQIFCLGLSEQTILGRNLSQCPSYLNFWTFSVTSKHFSNHDKNIQQVSCVKNFIFNGFLLALFWILGLGQNLNLENFQLCRLVAF